MTVVKICENSDLLLKVSSEKAQSKPSSSKTTDGSSNGQQEHVEPVDGPGEPATSTKAQGMTFAYQVRKQVLMKNAVYFAQQFNAQGPWGEKDAASVTLQAQGINHGNVNLEVWFRTWHGTMNKAMEDLPTNEVHKAIAAGDMYQFKANDLRPWFDKWILTHMPKSLVDHAEKAFPCYYFDHAAGFAKATRYLVYHSVGHISESYCSAPIHMHLDHRVIRRFQQPHL